MERVWDRYLSDRDREHLAVSPYRPIGFGVRPALILVDNYRGVLGDEPLPLLESVKDWPMSTGMDGWEAIRHIQVILAAARRAAIPIVHVTALIGEFSIPMGASVRSIKRRKAARESVLDPETAARRARDFDPLPELAIQPGEFLIEKPAPSAFFSTPLIGHLTSLGVDTLIVVGESTSGCIRATVVDGASYRFHVIVPEECTYDRHEAPHAINLFDMDRKYADVLPLERVLDWMTTLDPDEAKQ